LDVCGDGVTPYAPIVLRRGDDVPVILTFRDRLARTLIDWTTWTGLAAKAKDKVDGTVMAVASVTPSSAGKLTVVWPASQTSALTPGATGLWDLQGVDPDGLARTVAEGSVLVTGDITP
jgi:hypothetical protein